MLSFESLEGSTVHGIIIDLIKGPVQFCRGDEPASGLAAFVESMNTMAGGTNREFPRACRTLLRPLLDEVNQEDFHKTLDLIDCIFATHLIHLVQHLQCSAIVARLQMMAQLPKLFHDVCLLYPYFGLSPVCLMRDTDVNRCCLRKGGDDLLAE